MPKRHQITTEQLAEIEKLRIKNRDKNKEKRLKVLVLHAKGEKHSLIADKTGFAATYISVIVSKFCKHGLSSIVANSYKGNRRNLSFEEEKALLEPFRVAAAAGNVVEISAIKAAYEELTGTILEDNNKGQIYRVLKRHVWRKIMPRSKHPNKATDEVIEASKKLTMLSGMKWKILQADESD